MVTLDDLAALAALDAADMLGCVRALPDVLAPAYDRALGHVPPLRSPRQVLVCGMGGSAISGDMLRTWCAPTAPCPITVHRGDRLPAHAGADTLGVFLTYSGHTGETLGALREAIARGVPGVVVTSGGAAADLAAGAGLPVVPLPGGWQPRAAMGDLLFSLLGIVCQLPGFPEPDLAAIAVALEAQRGRCAPEVPTSENPAKQLALALAGTTPFVLGTTPTTEAVATRWKCQFNENAKLTCLLGTLPEFTHNDIVNLSAERAEGVAVLALADEADSPFVTRQREHTLDLLAPHVGSVRTLQGEGPDGLTRQLSLAYLGDWVSVYLGLLRGHDPTPVAAIGELKRRMAATSEVVG